MKKLFNIFFIVCILNTTFISCKTNKMLSVDEASSMGKEERSLIFHTPKKTYNLRDYKFLDDKLVGQLEQKTKQKGSAIHVYSDINYELVIDEFHSEYLELSNSHIQKITYSKVSAGKTVIWSSVLIVSVLWLVSAMTL